MKQIVLSDRLFAVVRYIKQDSAAADVGTDHGFIPVYLAQNNIARRIIAADVRKDPLSRAQASAREYGVSSRIEFVLTDGLLGLEDRGIDTVVAAGMGGETIAGILERAPWIKTADVRLILQPQTKQRELLIWLAGSGYAVSDASLVLDSGRIYTVILVGAQDSAAPNDILKILLDKREPLLPVYLSRRIAIAHREVVGLAKSSVDSASELSLKTRELETLIHMKEAAERWHVTK
jgi:tRNA (adenine22-N1)-methyltransferase